MRKKLKYINSNKLLRVVRAHNIKFSATSLYLSILVSLILLIFSSFFFLSSLYERIIFLKNIKYKESISDFNLLEDYILENYSKYEYNKKYSLPSFYQQHDSIEFYKINILLTDKLFFRKKVFNDTLHKCSYISSDNFLIEPNTNLCVTTTPKVTFLQDITFDGILNLKQPSNTTAKGFISDNKLTYWATVEKKESPAKLPNIISSYIERWDSWSNGNINNDISYNDNIIYSTTSVLIQQKDTNKLIIAPSIKIVSGFKGEIHLLASDSIIIDKDVHITFPSSIVLYKNNLKSFVPYIIIKENSAIESNIVAISKDISTKPLVQFKSFVFYMGLLYTDGMTNLPFSCNGSIYCAEVYSIFNSNVLKGEVINGYILTKSFSQNIGIPIVFSSKKLKPIIWRYY